MFRVILLEIGLVYVFMLFFLVVFVLFFFLLGWNVVIDVVGSVLGDIWDIFVVLMCF